MRFTAPLLFGLFLLCIFSAGCLTTGIGDIVYNGSAFEVGIEEDSLPEEVIVQIIIFRLDGLNQKEESLIVERRTIAPGDRSLLVSAPHKEGVYKAHLILFSGDKRIVGRIIDYTV